ncbi:MAG TPA: GNAT family N-acetyltransferase [Dehalococcoidia bacterium]|nr:GNAT family N-acetyltransferase [Dehalococcoidia bacterium]
MTVASSVVVREACEEDLPRILVLLYQLTQTSSHPEPKPRDLNDRHLEVFREFLGSPFFHLLVLEVDGTILGTLHLYLVPNIAHGGQPWAIVEHVVVDDTQRSKGYGEVMMAESVKMAKEAGAFKVSLGSSVLRVDSHRFYERIGFDAHQKGFILPLG